MEQETLESLHLRYTQARFGAEKEQRLDLEQFEQLVVFFPCLLVAASDGEVDSEEWIYIRYLSRFTTSALLDAPEGEAKAALEAIYLQEFQFLLDHLNEWKQPFMDALVNILEDDEEAKESILDALHLFADASEGVSSVEAQAIDQLIQNLKLEE